MDPGVGAHQGLRDTDIILQMSAPLLSQLLQRMTEFEHALLAEFPAQELALPTSDPRYELAAAAVLVALEHALAVRAAAQVGAMNSAAAVLRMQYEGLLRAAWLLFAANPAQVEKLAMPLSLAAEKGAKNLPGNLDMLADLEKVAPPGLFAPLAQFNQFSRHALNSFVHVGIHPLARVRTGFPAELAETVLRFSAGLMHLAYRLLATLTGSKELMGRVTRLHSAFSDCLPVHKQPNS